MICLMVPFAVCSDLEWPLIYISRSRCNTEAYKCPERIVCDCAQLTRDLFAIAKFLYLYTVSEQISTTNKKEYQKEHFQMK